MKNITYSIQRCYLDERVVYQPVYCNKVRATPYFNKDKALLAARKIAESIRQSYIERGMRARTVYIDPINYDTESLDVTA
jgi:hypothetical protein